VSAVEKVLIKFEKRLPSTNIKKFVVTRAVVENPELELEKLLNDPQNPEMLKKFDELIAQEKLALKESILKRKSEFEKRYDYVFPENQIELIANRMVEKGYDVNTVFEEVVEIRKKVERFERDFNRRTGLEIEFNEEALNRIIEIILNVEGQWSSIFSRLSKDYEYGLELIREKTGQSRFVITKEAVDDPEGYLNRMILEIYRRESDQRLEVKE